MLQLLTFRIQIWKLTNSQCLKIARKVAFNIAFKASYVYSYLNQIQHFLWFSNNVKLAENQWHEFWSWKRNNWHVTSHTNFKYEPKIREMAIIINQFLKVCPTFRSWRFWCRKVFFAVTFTNNEFVSLLLLWNFEIIFVIVTIA